MPSGICRGKSMTASIDTARRSGLDQDASSHRKPKLLTCTGHCCADIFLRTCSAPPQHPLLPACALRRASPIHVTNAANSLERPLFKLTERFVKSQSAGLVLDGTPAARRTFYLPQGDIELDLHRSPGHITSDRLVLTRKGALRSTKLVNPLSDPPHELKVKAMLQSLLEDEFQAIAVGAHVPWLWS